MPLSTEVFIHKEFGKGCAMYHEGRSLKLVGFLEPPPVFFGRGCS
jgi:hypothetical protein